MSLIIVNIFLAGKYEFDIHFFPHVQIWLEKKNFLIDIENWKHFLTKVDYHYISDDFNVFLEKKSEIFLRMKISYLFFNTANAR